MYINTCRLSFCSNTEETEKEGNFFNSRLEKVLIGISAALCTLIVIIICCCKFKRNPRYLCRNMKHCMCCLRKKDKDSNETLFTQEKKNTKGDMKKNKCCALMTCCMNKTDHIPLEELGPKP